MGHAQQQQKIALMHQIGCVSFTERGVGGGDAQVELEGVMN